jgi:predicted transposase YdaD
MAKPFDATTKDLLESDPVAWMAYLGLHPQGAVEVIDSDLSTITAEADKVFRVSGPEPYLVHVEMQSSADTTLPHRLLRYNVLLDYRHKMRVWSVAILLRPEAEAATLTGSLDLRLPDGQQVHDFRYGVVKTWRQSAEAILQGPLSTLPMALLADVPPESARTVLQRIDERLIREATEPEAARLINSTLLLAGLRFEKQTLAQLFLGVRSMNLLDAKILKDSSAYELLKDMIRPDLEKEVRVEEARSILVNLATRRFGEPTEAQKALLDGITDHDHLVRLCEKVGSLSTWDELLEN